MNYCRKDETFKKYFELYVGFNYCGSFMNDPVVVYTHIERERERERERDGMCHVI